MVAVTSGDRGIRMDGLPRSKGGSTIWIAGGTGKRDTTFSKFKFWNFAKWSSYQVLTLWNMHWYCPRKFAFANGHTVMNIPDPIRTRQSSITRPGQYWGGGPPGKPFGCRWLFMCSFAFRFRSQLRSNYLGLHLNWMCLIIRSTRSISLADINSKFMFWNFAMWNNYRVLTLWYMHWYRARKIAFANGHTVMNIPDPIRTRQSSITRPGQYWGGGPPGKPFGCRWLFMCAFAFRFRLRKNKTQSQLL